jgi:thiamine-monophosphate kinase
MCAVLSEFEIVRRYFTRPANAILGVGDDAALVGAAPGKELAISTDMLVERRHFFAGADPCLLGHKALAVNLSDMAAMGALPRWVLLALALPEANEQWLEPFSHGFFELARTHAVELIGGDISRGPLNICVTIIGETSIGKALRRGGARPADDVWVSGKLGDAALALAHLQKRIALDADEFARSSRALHAPTPRVELGQNLIGIATSAIDISDGLFADLTHILESSDVGAAVEFAKIPRSDILQRHLDSPIALSALLAGGDDYELCFTASPSHRDGITALSGKLKLTLTRIGRIEEGRGLTIVDDKGVALDLEREKLAKGFDHFG